MTSKDVLQRLETWGIDDADSEELHALLADAARELRDTRVGAGLTLKDFGYAPGNYIFKGLDCGQEAVGDKRAGRCETCAVRALQENRSGAAKPSVRKAERFDIFPDDGCNRCPWVGGVMAERDCHFPDCVPEWKPNDDPNGWCPIYTAPKNGRFQVALEGIPEHAWPAYRTDGGSIYSNAHGILNSKVHGRLTVATHWRPSQPAPFQPDFLRYPHHPRSRG